MTYNEMQVVPMFWDNHMGIYSDVYEKAWNSMAFIKDEEARVRAVNGYMVTFTKAMGMDLVGAASFDETLIKAPSFKSFAVIKQNVVTNAPSAQNVPQSSVPQTQTNAAPATQPLVKTPYVSNGKPLEGGISPGQKGAIDRFLGGKGNEEMKAAIYQFMGKFGKNDTEDLSKAEASIIMDACSNIIETNKAKKAAQQQQQTI